MGEITTETKPIVEAAPDSRKRLFLRGLAVVVVGLVTTSFFPKRADALVMGSTPGSTVLGLKNSSNARINPATEDTLSLLRTGNSVLKKTVNLSASGTVHTPSSGKKIRVYSSKFSMDANLTSVSFRFTSGGSDFEIYLSPRAGGLYGSNNHPNYFEGGTDQVLYCAMSGTGTVQINVDYLEV